MDSSCLSHPPLPQPALPRPHAHPTPWMLSHPTPAIPFTQVLPAMPCSALLTLDLGGTPLPHATLCSSCLFREAMSDQGNTSLLSPLPCIPSSAFPHSPCGNDLKSASWCVSCLLSPAHQAKLHRSKNRLSLP